MNKKVLILIGIVTSLMLGGCIDLSNANEDKNNAEINEQGTDEESIMVSINDYTGAEYGHKEDQEALKIAEENREEVETVVKTFFLDEYKTEVEVKNIVGVSGAAAVYVESVGIPKFYTYAVVPVIKEDGTINKEGVFTEEGQVEQAIRSGLYAMIHEEELSALDQYLEEFVVKNNLAGMRMEAVESVKGTGFGTSYYYITALEKSYEEMNQLYIDNPNWSKQDWKNHYADVNLDPENIIIAIQLYMGKEKTEPNQAILDELISGIEGMEELPPASYALYLHDNDIDKKTAVGSKDSTIKRAYPNYIIKD